MTGPGTTGPAATGPDMTGSGLPEVLTRHYGFGPGLRLRHLGTASGSTNTVSLIEISEPDHGGVSVAVRCYDTRAPQYEPELLLAESAVRAVAHLAGLLVDEVIPAASGDGHVRAGHLVYSLHRLLPGEALTWPRWADFQQRPSVPECLGGLQALWDRRVGGTEPAALIGRAPAAEWPTLGGHGEAAATLTEIFVEQCRPGPRLDLTGRANPARFDWAAEIVARHAARWPCYARLFGRWFTRLRQWAADFDESLSDLGSRWLQHGDPSPTNTFFLPRVHGWRAVGGITDFELVRFAAFRSDVGVAGSLRLGDTPAPAQVAQIMVGRETAVPLDLRLLERYLAGYQAMAPELGVPGGGEVAAGLRANVLGLALWSVQMMRAGHYPDEELAGYLAAQLHRYLARRCTPDERLDQAVRRAFEDADSVRQEVQVRLQPAAAALVP
ncbi:MAG TPA: hypothetical protein VGG25_16500 [Streptosporangiaceae bacterium]